MVYIYIMVYICVCAIKPMLKSPEFDINPLGTGVNSFTGMKHQEFPQHSPAPDHLCDLTMDRLGQRPMTRKPLVSHCVMAASNTGRSNLGKSKNGETKGGQDDFNTFTKNGF